MGKVSFVVLVFLFLTLNTCLIPSSIYAGFAEGVKKYTAGDFEGAIPEFDSALKEDKENEKVKTYLLRCLLVTWEKYQRAKSYDKALSYLRKAHEIAPNDPEVKKLYETVLKESNIKVVLGTSVENKGDVLVQRKGKIEWDKVESNSPVYPTDVIKTGKDSECNIVFDEGTVLRIENNAEIAFENLTADEAGIHKIFGMNQVKGRVVYNIERLASKDSKFSVRTRVCVAAVRGTEFATEVKEDQTTEIAVFSGAVTVANLPKSPGEKAVEVVVEKGKQIAIGPEQIPSAPTEFNEKYANYSNEIIPQFEQYVTAFREELELIAMRRGEYIKRQREGREDGKIISQKIASLRTEGETAYREGRYNIALMKFEDLATYTPEDTQVKKINSKLTKIVKILSEETRTGNVPNLVRISLTNHLHKDGDPKLSINAIRYATQFEPRNEVLSRIRELIETEYSTIATAEKLVPGMNLVEQKLLVALNSIYDGRYDITILECNEVLQLEPYNITAYKRLGSAYWSLGKKEEARMVWQAGLKLAPNDEELKSALKTR